LPSFLKEEKLCYFVKDNIQEIKNLLQANGGRRFFTGDPQDEE